MLQRRLVKVREKDVSSSSVIEQCYQMRKKSFAEVLDKTLLYFKRDQIGRQMLKNTISGSFIADRIEEIITALIKDDQEQFIERLISQMKENETLLKQEENELEQILGDNKEELKNYKESQKVSQRLRYIRLLSRILKGKDHEIRILEQDLKAKDAMLKGFKSKKRIDYNPESKEFMHVFQEIDVTNLSHTVRDIENDATKSKQSVQELKEKMNTIITLMRSQVKKAVELYDAKINRLEARYKMDKTTISELKKSSDTEAFNKESEIESLKIRLKIAEDKVTSSRALFSSMEHDSDFLKRENERLKLNIQEVESKLLQTKKENMNLTKELEEYRIENKGIAAELEVQSSYKNDATTVLHKKDNDLMTMQREFNELKIIVSEKTIELHNANEKMVEFTKKVAELKRINNEIQLKIDNQFYQNNDHIQMVNTHQKQIKTAKMESSSTNRQLVKQEGDKTDTDSNAKTLEEKFNHEILTLKRNKDGIERILNDNKKTIESQKEEINEINKQNDHLSAQVKLLKHELSLKDTQIDNIKLDSENNINMLQELVEKKTNDIDLCMRKENELQKKLSEKDYQISLLKNENLDLVDKSKEYEASIDRLRKIKSETFDESQKIQFTLEEYKQKNLDLSSKIKGEMTKIERLEKLVEVKDSENESLLKEIESVRVQLKEIVSERDELKRINAKSLREGQSLISKAEEAENENKEKLLSFENANHKMSKQLGTLIGALSANNFEEASDNVRKLIDIEHKYNEVFRVVGAVEGQNVPEIIAKFKEDSNEYKKINESLQGSSVNFIKRMKKERDTICNKIGVSSEVNLVDEFNLISETKDQLTENLKESTEFLSKVVNIIVGQQQSPRTLSFPMTPSRKQQIIGMISKLLEAYRKDHSDVDFLLSEANKFGFQGTDVETALSTIIKANISKESDVHAQSSNQKIQQIKEEMESQISENAQQFRATVEKKEKELKELKGKLIIMSEKAISEREEYEKTSSDYEKKIRDLSEQLSSEKILRAEISRIGAGDAMDKKMLKSKLSTQEFKLIEFIEKIMRSESEAKSIRDSLRKTREENLETLS